MDVKFLIDKLAENARPLGTAIFLISVFALLLRTRVARRLRDTIEETVFTNWRLALLGTTGIVLSAAAGWRTWEGMYNFTGEPLLSGMVTFGIQGIMLIVAWLIGESFATGMNARARPGTSSLVSAAMQPWLGSFIGLLLFITGFVLFLQWTGQTDVKHANVENLGWANAGDKFLMLGAGLLMVSLFALYAANDLVRPYLQVVRVIIRNSMLWLMFLACMATSVFFSFDSFFTAIFPQSERVRAAELRAQNQVSGILSDIEQALGTRSSSLAAEIFTTEAWKDYEHQLDAITEAATQSQGAIERYVNAQIEERSRAVKEQQERIASAEAGQAGLAGRKTSLTDEKSRLAAQRPELAADYATKKAEYDAKMKDVDAKRVEALAEDKGVEGTLKAGRGPIYRQRMSELAMLQGAAQIAGERMKDAQKRLNTVESRLTAIDTELATLDGDLAKYKGEAETAKQRIALTDDTAKDDSGPKIDPSKIMPAFDRSKSEFRADPSTGRLAAVQRFCNDIYGALSATPETKPLLNGIDCDPKAVSDAASGLFALQSGTKVFQDTCVGGDRLVENKSTDDLFAFARRCLSDSALPSNDTAALRSKINRIELSRDDKAHRFVVTLNAFQDGNRLAYLALAIAIGLDGLIFMSGLFGANAVRSPLSDIPSFRSRSGSQLEATINAALGAHPYETAWQTLTAFRPITNQDGFSALADLSAMERSQADRVRMVLTAGADIGAVETISHDPERYRVRSELREYLSSVVDRQFKTDASAKDRARLDQLVSAALAPHPREHSEIVLNTLEPIRETEGFTSMVTLTDISNDHDARIVRRVMNAGSAVKAVAPDLKIADRYYIRPTLYETLLTIRATAPESRQYRLERARAEGFKDQRAIDGGALHAIQPELQFEPHPRELEKPRPALPRISPLSDEERAQLIAYYRETLLEAVHLGSDIVDKRLSLPQSRDAILEAWKTLNSHSKKNENLGFLLREFQNDQDRILSEVFSGLRSETGGDERKLSLLEGVDGRVRDDLPLYMLFPETGLVSYLIEELEAAARPDDGLVDGEQQLKDQLRSVRDALGRLDLDNPQSWDEIRKRLAVRSGTDFRNFFNRPIDRDEPSNDGDV
ncbi:hypothetical protein HYPDE_37688 [Hyphomicrobium denitrificans 1NES1]|uniref:Uncharacterized protein n=1 Tax=Hyphomicrobium denitrificans 1NES1 TaxID=670307 RepID=N0B6I8_9HYPH|nr:hypothetical protein [Hyphomicrobium denitrificans]AGK59209.1 hypothetical protein HYPDE_37688 [Hyphomicrobium denitrificans 1NES1]